MLELIKVWMPWFLSALTIYQNLLVGRKRLSGWVLGMIGQVFWLMWIYADEAWGLLPLNIMLCWVYVKNYRLWKGQQLDE